MFTLYRRLLTLSISLSCLSACAPLVSMIGYSGAAVQVAVQLDRAKLFSDGVSYLGSGKTVTDHAVSVIARADCRVLNLVTPNPVCSPKRDEPAVARTERINVAALRETLRGGDAGTVSEAPPRGNEVPDNSEPADD